DTLSTTLAVTATDRAGNQTTQPFTLFKDTISPTVTIAVPPVAPLHFRVSWLGQDGESGLRDYDVQYKVGVAGTWTSWLTNTSQTEAPFVGERDQSYYFRVQATDNVNNTSAWVEAGPVVVSAVTKYYYHGDQRVAMRQGDVVYYLHSDHLGSTSLTTDITGTVVAETRYLPYGEERWKNEAQPTDFAFTGQRAERGFGLMDYNARYYDPWLGRFVSADTVVPEAGNPQDWNRYSYAANNLLKFNDPSGHCRGLSGAAFDICAEAILAVAPAVHKANELADSVDNLVNAVGGSEWDAVGWRVEVSGGILVAGDLNIDVVMKRPDLAYDEKGLHFKEGAVDIFTSYGAQGADIGVGVSTGPLFIYNLPSLDDYTGTTNFLGASGFGLLEGVGGAEANVFWSPQSNSEGTTTWGWHVGGGVGFEIFAGGGVSQTDYLEDFYNDRIVPIVGDFGIDIPQKEPWFWEKGKMWGSN
ncbi:MAG: RHS repeat-associated core domain-containing protein, partial [Anaerolineae bacterium]